AAAIQVFDSWVGALSVEDYTDRVLPHTRSLLEALAPLNVPRIHFGTGTAGLLESIASAGPDLVSLDWRVPLDRGWERVGHRRGIQGNPDPAVLLGPPDLVRARAPAILRRAGGRPRPILHPGPGVLPETPLENPQPLGQTGPHW